MLFRSTTDVRGTPTLDAAGQVLTLRNVTVTTRRSGLTGRVLAWLADARAQAYVTQAARFDLRPRLDGVRAQVQGRLPFSPAPGVTLGGTLRALKVTDVRVTPDALVVTGEALGTLDARVDVGRAVR